PVESVASVGVGAPPVASNTDAVPCPSGISCFILSVWERSALAVLLPWRDICNTIWSIRDGGYPNGIMSKGLPSRSSLRDRSRLSWRCTLGGCAAACWARRLLACLSFSLRFSWFLPFLRFTFALLAYP